MRSTSAARADADDVQLGCVADARDVADSERGHRTRFSQRATADASWSAPRQAPLTSVGAPGSPFRRRRHPHRLPAALIDVDDDDQGQRGGGFDVADAHFEHPGARMDVSDRDQGQRGALIDVDHIAARRPGADSGVGHSPDNIWKRIRVWATSARWPSVPFPE